MLVLEFVFVFVSLQRVFIALHAHARMHEHTKDDIGNNANCKFELLENPNGNEADCVAIRSMGTGRYLIVGGQGEGFLLPVCGDIAHAGLFKFEPQVDNKKGKVQNTCW